MAEPVDHYEVLQVSQNASPEVIESVYRRLARMHHPDVDKSLGANEGMAQINRAYEELSDSKKRAVGLLTRG